MLRFAISAILLLCVPASAEGPFPPGTRFEYQGRTVIPHGLRIIETRQDSGDSVTAATPARADGPLFSIYPVAARTDTPEKQQGHSLQWELDRIAEGLPLEPAVFVHAMHHLDLDLRMKWLEQDRERLAQFDNGPLVLRVGNISGNMELFDPRFPLTEENWRTSWRCVRRDANGLPDDEERPDPFSGLTQKWYEIGARWANTRWMRRVQEIIPNPTQLIMRENNESGRVKWDKDIVDKFGAWKSESYIRNVSMRAWEWVAAKQAEGGAPASHLEEFEQLERDLYQALYRGFDENLTLNWRGKLYTTGYGGPHENHQNDTSSQELYMSNHRPSELTSPEHIAEWRQRRADNWDTLGPRGWAELSIRMRGTTMVMPALAGLHDVVDPESYAGYMTFGLWVMQHPGRDVRYAYYENTETRPDSIVLVSPTWIDAANQLGRPDLLTLMCGDYEIALMQRMRQIHDHPIINRYWREGTTCLIDSPQNTATEVKVYATETTIPGIAQTLLTVYTPCALVGEIQVGQWTVPAKRFAYYLTGQIQEVE